MFYKIDADVGLLLNVKGGVAKRRRSVLSLPGWVTHAPALRAPPLT